MLQTVSYHTLHRLQSNILAYELATSLAPLPKAEKMKAIEVIARIQSYFAVNTDGILNEGSCKND
jgi:hypothetical protein